MIGRIIGGFLAGLVAKIVAFFAIFKLGNAVARNEELKRDVEAAYRIAQGAQDKPADRAELADRVQRGDW